MEGRESDRHGIGQRVRTARERLGLSREALAFHAGISWSAITQVESGRRTNLRPSTLAALSRPLRVSIDYLVNGKPSCPTMLEHAFFPYRSDDQFRTTSASFLAAGLERSEATLVVTTERNIELLRERFGRDARRIEFLDASGFYTTPSAALEGYGAFLDLALERGAHWVRVVGEPIWTRKSDAEVRLWTRYESLFNLVFAASPLTAICPYDERSVHPEIVRHAHLTHPSAADDRGVSPSPDFTAPAQVALELT
jgi:transcriptional regulator with XRE-family HTH domain